MIYSLEINKKNSCNEIGLGYKINLEQAITISHKSTVFKYFFIWNKQNNPYNKICLGHKITLEQAIIIPHKSNVFKYLLTRNKQKKSLQ